MPESMIEFHDVTKRYPNGHEALRNVSLRIESAVGRAEPRANDRLSVARSRLQRPHLGRLPQLDYPEPFSLTHWSDTGAIASGGWS